MPDGIFSLIKKNKKITPSVTKCQLLFFYHNYYFLSTTNLLFERMHTIWFDKEKLTYHAYIWNVYKQIFRAFSNCDNHQGNDGIFSKIYFKNISIHFYTYSLLNLFMFAIIPTKLKQMQSGPKYCGREIFHKYLGGLQTKRICLGICCHGTFRKFSHQITE